LGQSDLYLLLFIHLYISQINPRFGSILTNLMGFIPKQYKYKHGQGHKEMY